MAPRPHTVISISIYNEDLQDLDDKVAALKRRGISSMSRSALIRIAVGDVDVEQLATDLLQRNIR